MVRRDSPPGCSTSCRSQAVAGIAARAMARLYARTQAPNFSMSDAALGQKRPLYQTKKFAISFALLASSCPFVVERRHEIGVREA